MCDPAHGYVQVELPLDVGTINVYGFTCPAMPGPVSYGLDIVLPSIAPSGSYVIKITGQDQDSVPALCISAHLEL